MNAFRRVVSAILLGCLYIGVQPIASAQIQPDAGSITRDQAPLPHQPSKGTTTLPVLGDKPLQSEDPGPIPVKTIRVADSSVFSAETLEVLVADLKGGLRTLGELQSGARRITAYYRRAGYFLARAYVPKQQMADGVVTIAVLEGKLDKVQVENASRLSATSVDSHLATLEPGSILQKAPTERALLLLSDLPGIGGVDSRLGPGANTGESVLVANVKAAALWSGRLEADNYGSLYSGRYRLGGSVDANSPLGYGERFSARLLASDDGLAFGRLAAQVPLGADGLTLGAALGHTEYSLGETFSALDAVGQSDTAELELRYPLVRSTAFNVYAQGGLQYRKLRDEIRSTDTRTDKHATIGTAGVTIDWRDNWLGGGASQVNLTLSGGDLEIETAEAAALDAAGARTEGGFAKAVLSVDRQQALVGKLSLAARASAQWSDGNLDSSEKFTLGGPYGIRAYPVAEGAGDRGWQATVELRYALMDQLSASVFYDVGEITVNARPYLATDNTRGLSGFGLGLAGSYKALDWRLATAWRHTGTSESEPDKTPRLWAQVGWRF